MVQLSPPPSSNSGELLQHGFHHLIRHNAATSFPSENSEYDERVQLLSGSDSSFALPAPAYQDDGYHYGSQQPSYTYENRYPSSGLGIRYDGYSPEPNQDVGLHNEHQVLPSQYSTPAASPPTQSMPAPVSDTMRTRSGLAVNRAIQPLKPLPQGRSRPSKSPKMKKVRKDKIKLENKVAKLDKPLSELTKAWDHVPIVDIEAYVNRSVEERRKEVEEGKIPGKVKRPMNSFMLYRKAYQNRTKNWCLQNNHQVVSQVCGDSWPLEPESVREQFNEWSKIERANHQNAHPGYKFSPSKGSNAKPSKRKASEEAESEESDLEQFDWERGETKKQKPQPRPVSRAAAIMTYSRTSSPYGYSREISEEPSFRNYNRSSYQATNPRKPVPAQYNQLNLQSGEYYQQTVHQNASILGVEDVVIRKTAAPGMHYLGLPGGQAYDMMGSYQLQEGNMVPEHKIDPSLIAQGNETCDDGYVGQEILYLRAGSNSDPHWQGPYGLFDRDIHDESQGYLAPQKFDNLQIQEQHMQLLRGNQEGWSVEPLDVGQEFDKWMDEA